MSSAITIARLRPHAPYFFFGTVGLGFAYNILHNAELSNLESTPVTKAAVFTLRHDANARRMLGDDIHLDPRKMTKGEFNMFKGRANYQFKVKGSEGEALVRIQGERTAAKDIWNLRTFAVEPISSTDPALVFA
ncbi:cytochrome oxidase complex assembly protein 1-domain-containing protein [Chytriomyces sp. MP71]|nr:cytochrome oxidase complex assembly protein 1-domain-containing protein [Chytriomyces sp. MP71]